MWLHIDPSGGPPIYIQIREQIKRAVATGFFKPGDQLPSVRDLAVQLTVNPNTVSRAYLELERDGVIKTVRGVGTFVSEKEIKIEYAERVKLVKSVLGKALVEAYHLGFTEAELRELFEETLKEWGW
ncbi:GntR family transcriptional regulator [Thermincola ferriacetica]|uniref:GntR family transcriptional regulator n=1 Tax=Thermincola ferriacetica TaxID=281456 RepID=A0A0L6W3R8_9FIRM|nr:GntR family transcriptional regulator [Thermincola ferriacetica]KNZ70003.1 GntR family transcriptional regulator [Thermincola ferriacetica]